MLAHFASLRSPAKIAPLVRRYETTHDRGIIWYYANGVSIMGATFGWLEASVRELEARQRAPRSLSPSPTGPRMGTMVGYGRRRCGWGIDLGPQLAPPAGVTTVPPAAWAIGPRWVDM